jgi:hypothetical protein
MRRLDEEARRLQEEQLHQQQFANTNTSRSPYPPSPYASGNHQQPSPSPYGQQQHHQSPMYPQKQLTMMQRVCNDVSKMTGQATNVLRLFLVSAR